MLTEVRVNALDGYGYAYQKFNRRSEDWAMVAVSAVVKASAGTCEDVRIGLTNMALGAAAGDRGRGGAARPGPEPREHRAGGASRRPTAPSRPPTSTRAPTTSATWRVC